MKIYHPFSERGGLAIAIFSIISVIAWSFGSFLPQALAIGTTAATDLTAGTLRLKQASSPTAVLKIQLGSDSNGENLTAIAIAFTGTAGTPTWTQGAAASSELLDLAATNGGVSLWKESGDAAGFQASGVATDTPITLAPTPVYSAANVFTITPASPPAIVTDDIYYVALKTDTSGLTNNNAFTVTVSTNGVVTSESPPTITAVTTAPITIDTVAPTIDNSRTGPGNGAINVPISSFINVGFSENIDSATVNNTNITLTGSSTPVGIGFKTMSNGFAVTVSDPPTYATSTSRFAKVANTSFGFFMIPGSGSITPMGTYAAPAAGDIVYFQHETFPAELGIITNATLTAGTFGVNNFTLFGGQQLVKFASAATTTAVSSTTPLNKGDIVVVNTTANPTGDRYAWHIVTSADAVAVNHNDFRLDSSSAKPTFVTGSSLSAIAPAATATDNGATGGGTLAVVVGDMVFAKLAGGSYGWHIATGAGNLSSTSTEATAKLDSLATAAASQVEVGSVMSKLASPSAQDAVTDTTTSLDMGDVIFAKTTAGAANNNAYNYHIVSGAAASVSNAALRLDNTASNLAVSTPYILTIGTGLKDKAGNALASQQTLTFTTGGTGSTNMTPPFVQSTQPQGGVQNFPPNAPVKVTFSVDMAADGGAGSVTNTSNVGLFMDSYGAPGSLISTTNTYDPVTRTVSLTPSPSLGLSTGYMVKVANTTMSSTGAAMFNEFRLFFRTNATVDNSAPTVLGVSPANNATTTRSTIVSVGFSEDINPANINTTNVTLEKTSGNIPVTGSVGYTPSSRTAQFAPSSQLEGNTNYTLKLLAGVTDLAGNPLSSYSSVFNTNNDTDSTGAAVVSVNADNYGVAATFSEPVKSGNSPSSADNIANYTLESPVGSSISLSGKSVAYDAGTKTAKITGLSLQNGNTFKVTVSNLVQDLANNGMQTSGTPALNTGYGTVQNSNITGGQLGPGSGPGPDPGMQGMNPIRVMPMNRAAGATSSYKIEFPVSSSTPALGQIVLTFPTGFDVTNATSSVAGTASFCNSDLNGPQTGIVTIGSVAKDNAAGTVTINTAGADTGNNAFLCLDLSGIVNSTIPSTSGYTVDIKTRDTVANNRTILESKTSAPFFLGQTGSGTLTVNFFKDAGQTPNGTNDAGEGINGATVFLFSPGIGGQEATTTQVSGIDGVASFSNLTAGTYQVGVKPSASLAVAFNSMPQSITVAGTGETVKNFALSNAATINITGSVTWADAAGVQVDVFASSQNGFTKTTLTLTGGGASDNYTLPIQPSNTYNVGVGPAIPESFMTPGSPPPPPPDFVFMPPPNLQITATTTTISGQNFTLTATGSNRITGTVKDSASAGVSNAGVFCRPMQSSTGGSSSGFGTGAQTDTAGAFNAKVTPGVYLCGAFKPGMPPVPDKQVSVALDGAQTPSSLDFVLDVGTSLTISGTVKDDSGNAISYAGVSGRKVVSTSDTTVMGGDPSNFVGGPTDVNGAYTLYVSTGTWVVEAFAPGFGRLGTKTITISSSNATGQDFSTQTMTFRTITGTATRSSAATQGVMVRAENSTGTSGNMTYAAADGTYTIKVPDGTYNVTCFFPGLGDIAAIGGSVTLNSSNTTEVRDCTAGAPITITVNVTDGTNPITNAGVDVRDANGRGNFINVSTASTTNATLAVYSVLVPPGTYNVRVGHPTYGPIGQTLGVDSTRAITYTAAAGETYAVTGTVKVGANTLSGAWVSLIGTATGQTNAVFLGGQSQANGTFSISVPAGSYRLRVDKPGYRSPAEQTVAVAAATAVGDVVLTTASRTITGTVTLSGSPVSNAFVDAADGAGGYAVSQTDVNGAYSLAVDNGTWTLRAHAPGYEGGPLPVTVNNDSPSSQTIALTAMSGFTVKPEKPETVTPTSGGFLTNADIGSNFKLNIPANALGTGSNAATVTTKVNTAMPNPPSGAILSKNAVTISAVGSDGSKISSLNDSITIVVPYDEANLPAGTSESNLVLGTWNDATQSYDTLSTTVDTTANTLTATVSHLSDFAPMVPSVTGAPATPTGLAASRNSDGTSVTLTWNAVSGATSYYIYKSTDNSTFPYLASASGVSYQPTGLTAGTLYYFKVSAVNATGGESAASSAVSIVPALAGGGGGGYIATDTTPPSNTSISINAGAATTSALSVSLSLAATDAVQMMIANTSEFTGATWESYAISKTWTLTSGDGTKTAYAKFRDAAGNISAAVSDSIVLSGSNTAPATPATPASQPAPAGAHPNGTLILVDKTVYLVKNGKLYAFRDADEYKSHGYNFGQLVSANAVDKLLPIEASSIIKALEGTLVLDASDNKTVYMIGLDNTKRGFVSEQVFKGLGYKFGQLPKINLSDYPVGPVITTAADPHPEGALVLEGKTVWWILGSTKQGFESMAVFNTYGFPTSRIVKVNAADLALPQGPLVKFRDGTLVKDGGAYYLISEGTARTFASLQALLDNGYKRESVITSSLSAYEKGEAIQ